MSSLCVVFAGGGTGGHLFPGIAIAEALRAARADARISFVGSRRKLEATVVPKLGYPFDPIWIAGLRRSVSLETLALPFKLLVSLLQSHAILRRRKPDVVVGTGGYVSGPLVYQAARGGYPTLIHEQNEYPGITTRTLARWADEVHVTYESSRAHLPAGKAVFVSGNPVRPSLVRGDAGDARRSFGLEPERATVLCFGGSLGASSLNAALRAAIPRAMDAGVQILWQTGAREYDTLRGAVNGFEHRVALRPFIEEMHLAYSAATLVVCRAGATSIAEITTLGLPSVLVPYPHAAADHQRRNARALAAAGAAVLLEDADLDRFAETVLPLLADAQALDRLARNAATAGRPNAARDIAGAVIRLAERGRRR